MTVTITAGTSYEYGIDYSLSAVNITRPSGVTTNIPVKVFATTNDLQLGFTPAAEHIITDTNNFSLGTGHINPTNSANSETDGGLIAQRITGTITVTAYIDAQQVAITDTPENNATWRGDRLYVSTDEWNRLAETPITFAVKVVADEGATPPAPTMSLSSNSGSVYTDSTKTITLTTNSDGALSCTSSDVTKATCSIANGNLEVTGVAEGSATITVNQAKGTNNIAGSITYAATVMIPFRGTASQLASSASLYGLETTDYGKIYTGSDPDNYVWFNGEQWRILGVYGDKLKIVRATPLTTSQKYNADSSKGNAWSGSDLETFLNGDYYNGVVNEGLTETAIGMIAEGTWNAGATTNTATATTAYQAATGTQVSKNVGLIATYEYLYAAGSSCRTIVGNYGSFNTTCGGQDWLKPRSTVWTLSPDSDYSRLTLNVRSGGHVGNGDVDNTYGVSPAVYLDSSITITGGNGGIGETNSYKLG